MPTLQGKKITPKSSHPQETRYEKALSLSASRVLSVDSSNSSKGSVVQITSPLRQRQPHVVPIKKKPIDSSEFDIMSTVGSVDDPPLQLSMTFESSTLSHISSPVVKSKPKPVIKQPNRSIVDRTQLTAVAVPTAVVNMNELFCSVSLESPSRATSPPRPKSPLTKSPSKGNVKLITDNINRPITPMTPHRLRSQSQDDELDSLAEQLFQSIHVEVSEPEMPTVIQIPETTKLPALASKSLSSKGLNKPLLRMATHNLSLNDAFNDSRSEFDNASRSTHKLSIAQKSKSSVDVVAKPPNDEAAMMIGEAGFEGSIEVVEVPKIQEIEGSLEPPDVSVLTPQIPEGGESELLSTEHAAVAGINFSATVITRSNSNTALGSSDVIYTDDVDGLPTGRGDEVPPTMEDTDDLTSEPKTFVEMAEVRYRLKGKSLTRNQSPLYRKRSQSPPKSRNNSRGNMAVSKSTSALPPRSKSGNRLNKSNSFQQEHDAAILHQSIDPDGFIQSRMESPLTFGVGSDFDDDNVSETSTVSSVLKKSRERRRKEKSEIALRIAPDGSIYNANGDGPPPQSAPPVEDPRPISTPNKTDRVAMNVTAATCKTDDNRSVDSDKRPKRPRSVKLMPQNSVHSFEGSLSSASYRASLQRSLDLGSGVPPPPTYKLESLANEQALTGLLGVNQRSLVSINDSLSRELKQHNKSIASGDAPFQIHRRIMGWKLTSAHRRKDLVSILDVVTNKDPQGIMNVTNSRKLPSLNKVKSRLLSMNVNIVSVQEGSNVPDIVPLPTQSVEEISQFQMRQSKAWQDSVKRLVKFRQSYSSVKQIRSLVKDRRDRNSQVQDNIIQTRRKHQETLSLANKTHNNSDDDDEDVQYDPNYDSLLRTWTRAADRLSSPKQVHTRVKSRGISPNRKDLYNYPSSINRPSDRMDIINAVNTRLLFDALDDQTKDDLIVNDFLQNKYKHSRTDNSTVGEEDTNMLEMGGLFDELSRDDDDDLSSLGGMSMRESVARSLGIVDSHTDYNDEDCAFEQELHQQIQQIPVREW